MTQDVETRSRRHQKRKRGFTTYLGFILIAIALALFVVDPVKNYMIQQGAEQNQVANLTREDIQRNQDAEVTYDFDDIETLDAFTVLKDRVNPEDLPTIGGIAVPSVGINLPIYKGVSNEGMYLGAGTLFPDQQMGRSNYSLASHHSIHQDLLFAPLPKVHVGDKIYLTDLDKVYTYEVTMNQVVAPTRVDLIEPTEEDIITLITCDTGLVDRVAVQGKLIAEQPIDDAPTEAWQAFNMDQTVPD